MAIGIPMLILSAAVLAHELLLLRIIAICHWHHFGSMVIALALLGFGCSGVLVACLGGWLRRHARGARWLLLWATAVSLPASVWLAGLTGLNMLDLLWRREQYVWIACYALSLWVPFVLSASYIALVLSEAGRRVGRLYAINLVGSGLGAAGGVAVMTLGPPNGLVVMLALGVLAGAAATAWAHRMRLALALTGVTALGLIGGWAAGWPPLVVTADKTGSKMLRLADAAESHVRYGPLGRTAIVDSPRWVGETTGRPLGPARKPETHFVTVDGGIAVTVFRLPTESDRRFLDRMQMRLPYRLLGQVPRHVLLLGAGSHLDLLQARRAGAEGVTIVEPNGDVKAELTGPLDAFAGGDYTIDGLSWHVGGVRHFLEAGHGGPYDVIGLHVPESSGGVDALRETYAFTAEAVGAMLDRLGPGGMLAIQVTIHQQRAGLRVLTTVAAALEHRGRPFASSVVMIRDFAAALVLAAPDGFSARQHEAVRAFCREEQPHFNLCWVPGLRPEEVNDVYALPQPYYFLAARALAEGRRDELAAGYLFDILPASDDRPYFYRFFRPGAIPKLVEAYGVSHLRTVEKAYVFLWATLAVVIAIAVVLILVPLGLVRPLRRTTPGKPALLGYFTLLGLAYIALEIAFIQKCTLLVGDPVASMAVVVSAFLVFSGLGSFLADRLGNARRTLVAACIGIFVLALVGLVALRPAVNLVMGASLGVRILATVGLMAPLATLMGMPMPSGLRIVGRDSPHAVAWAWGVNGFAGVVGTLAAKILAVDVGFRFVLIAAGVAYLLAALVGSRLRTSPRLPNPCAYTSR